MKAKIITFWAIVVLIGIGSYLYYTLGDPLEITEESEVQLAPGGEEDGNGLALSLDAYIENNSSDPSQPYYAEFVIESEKLMSIISNPQRKYRTELLEVPPHSTMPNSVTVGLKGERDKNLYENLINNGAVKVNLLDENEKVIKSKVINDFEIDMRPEDI
ncbi:hypothetical protein SAMN05216353_102186 [Halobacillus alkaliphilus]|uniref:Uncharacterized protein n=1 Tax=Halobacillus alkaliphilus TaxID=396056 RepID=A0A1I2JUN1_9BACI|nr:hypothetical protein [Halobacillus alkaliphilus]SFF58525.1 hypothetical protein SAMN05216353_102186 [Halobacillus alkaliphilus]